MPPVPPQQGSRAGLIVALVVFVILTVVFAVFFFNERGQRQKAETDLIEEQRKPVGLLPEKLDSGDIQAAKNLVGAGGAGASSAGGEEGAPAAPAAPAGGYKSKAESLAPNATNAFDFVAGERNALVKAITPLAVTPRQAVDYLNLSKQKAQDTVKAAADKPTIAWNQDLGQVVVDLARSYVSLDTKVGQARAEADREKKAAESERKNLGAARDEFAKSLKASTDEVAQLKDEYNKLKTAFEGQVDPIRQQYAQMLAAEQAKLPPLTADITRLNGEVVALKKKIDDYEGIFRQYRMDASESTVRRPDGFISRIADDGKTVYINLGESDHITNGMTFEVYDAARGIPSLKDENPAMEDENARRGRAGRAVAAGGADKSAQAQMILSRSQSGRFETQLPAGGKGSLEVVRVGPGHSSMCRVIKMEPGQSLQQGDLIANLIYDPNIKPRVAIYGNFDLDYNGITDIKDADVIRRQVETWGGRPVIVKTEDEVVPDIDYLVMGIRPKAPALDAQASADAQAEADKIKQQQAAYDKIAQKARAYSIPVLNQTRFLYYTGYFDQRLR